VKHYVVEGPPTKYSAAVVSTADIECSLPQSIQLVAVDHAAAAAAKKIGSGQMQNHCLWLETPSLVQEDHIYQPTLEVQQELILRKDLDLVRLPESSPLKFWRLVEQFLCHLLLKQHDAYLIQTNPCDDGFQALKTPVESRMHHRQCEISALQTGSVQDRIHDFY
jgi:hypothetical protein